jgi:hypothetical protein
MSDKNFKVKNGITIAGLTTAGPVTTDASGNLTSAATLTIAQGGTGATTASLAATALLPSQTSNSGKYLTTDGAGNLSWGTVSGYSAPTIGSTSIASGATVTTLTGVTENNLTLTGTVTAGGSTGTSGQFLQTTATGVQWASAVPVTSSTVNTNTAFTIDTVAISGFTTIEYILSLKQGSIVRSSKIFVQNNGTSVDYVEYGVMNTGGSLPGVIVSALLSSTNSILQVTITNAATTNVIAKFTKVVI